MRQYSELRQDSQFRITHATKIQSQAGFLAGFLIWIFYLISWPTYSFRTHQIRFITQNSGAIAELHKKWPFFEKNLVFAHAPRVIECWSYNKCLHNILIFTKFWYSFPDRKNINFTYSYYLAHFWPKLFKLFWLFPDFQNWLVYGFWEEQILVHRPIFHDFFLSFSIHEVAFLLLGSVC